MIYTSKQLIEHLTSHPEIKAAGFWKAVERIVGEDELEEVQPSPKFVPDAFRVDDATKELHIYEVEVTNAMPTEKLAKVGDFADALGDYGWKAVIHVVNRYGHITELDAGDLFMYAIQTGAVE